VRNGGFLSGFNDRDDGCSPLLAGAVITVFAYYVTAPSPTAAAAAAVVVASSDYSSHRVKINFKQKIIKRQC
jgi:hypothetical protein